MFLRINLFIFLFIYIAEGDDDTEGYSLDDLDPRYNGSIYYTMMDKENSPIREENNKTEFLRTFKGEFIPIPDLINITQDMAEYILTHPKLFNYTASVQMKSMYGEDPEKYDETAAQLQRYLVWINYTTTTTPTTTAVNGVQTRGTKKPFAQWWLQSSTSSITDLNTIENNKEAENQVTTQPTTLETTDTSQTLETTTSAVTTKKYTIDLWTSVEIPKHYLTYSTLGFDDFILPTLSSLNPTVREVLSKVQDPQSGHGPFTAFFVKLFEIMSKKSDEEQRKLTLALKTTFNTLCKKALFEPMGNAGRILSIIIEDISCSPPDLVRTQAYRAKQVLENKDKLLATDLNDILNEFNKWYPRQGRQLIYTLPLVEQFKINTFWSANEVVEKVMVELLTPYQKMSEYERKEAFKPINEALEKRRISQRRHLDDYVRRFTSNRDGRNRRNHGNGSRHLYNRGKEFQRSDNIKKERRHDDRGKNFGNRNRSGNLHDEDLLFHDRIGNLKDGGRKIDGTDSFHKDPIRNVSLYYRKKHVNSRQDHIRDKMRNLDNRGRHLKNRSRQFHEKKRNIGRNSHNKRHYNGKGGKIHDANRSATFYPRRSHLDDKRRTIDDYYYRKKNLNRRHDNIRDKIGNLDNRGKHLKNRNRRFHDKKTNTGGNSHDKRHNYGTVGNSDDTNRKSKDRGILSQNFPIETSYLDDKSRIIDDKDRTVYEIDGQIELKISGDSTPEPSIKLKFVENKKYDFEKDNYRRYNKNEKLETTKKYRGLQIDTEREYGPTAFIESELEISREAGRRNYSI